MAHITVGDWDPLRTALRTSVAKRLHFPKAGVPLLKDVCYLVPSLLPCT